MQDSVAVTALLFLVCISLASAGTFIGLVPYTCLTTFPNGTIVAKPCRTLTFSCDATDPVMSYLIGDNMWSVSTCSQPTESYTVTAEAVAPRGLNIYNMRSCTSENPSDFLHNSTVPGNVDGNTPLRRRLYAEEKKIKTSSGLPVYMEYSNRELKAPYRFMHSKVLSEQQKLQMAESIGKHPRSRYKEWSPMARSKVINTVRKLLQVDTNKFCYGAAVGVGLAAVGVYCPHMNTMSEADVKHIATLRARIEVDEALAPWTVKVEDLLDGQVLINTQIVDLQRAYMDLSAAQFAFENTTRIKLDLLQEAFVAFGGAMTSTIQNVYANMTTGLALVSEYADTLVGTLQIKMLANFRAIIEILDDLAVQVADDAILSNTRFMSQAEILLDMQLTLYHSIAGTNRAADRADKALVFAALNEITEQGRIPFVRPLQPGTSPVAVSGQTNSQLRVFIDITRINYINLEVVGINTVRKAHQHIIGLWCNIATISNDIVDQITFESIMGMVAPVGCVANATAAGLDPVRRCRCWWELQHKSCTADTGFDWTDITTLSDKTAYDLTPDYCQGDVQPVSDTYDEQNMDSLTDFKAYVSDLACGSHPDDAGSSFQVLQKRTGVIYVQPNYAPAVCNFDYFQLFVKNSIVNATLPFVLFDNWVKWYPLLRTERGYSEIVTYGVRPGGITSVFVPHVTASNGLTVQCYDSAVASTGTDTNIIYRVVSHPMEPLVTTNVYDAQPDCTTVPGTCIPTGNLLSSVTSTARIKIDALTVGKGFDDGTILISELIPAASGGMTYVVDSAKESKCLSSDPETCKGSNGYLRFGIPSGYIVADEEFNPAMTDFAGLSTWESEHPGDSFDHRVPTSASFFEHPVDQQRCTVVPDQEFQEVCRVLQIRDIHPNTNMRTGGLVLGPVNWEYEVTLDIEAAGGLSSYVIEGCPEVSFEGGEITGTYLKLTNPLPGQISVSVSREAQSSPSCSTVGNLGNVDMGIPGYQSVPISVPVGCNFTMQVFSKMANGILRACGPSFSTFVSADTQNNILNSGLIANATQVIIENSVTQRTAATAATTLTFAIGIAFEAGRLAAVNTSVTLQEVIESAFPNSTLQAYLTALNAAAAGVNFVDPVFVQRFDALSVLQDQQAALVLALQNNASGLLELLTATVISGAQNTSELHNLTEILGIKLQAAIAAQRDEINFLNGELGKKSDMCPSFLTNPLGAFMCWGWIVLQWLIIAVAVYFFYRLASFLWGLYRANRAKSANVAAAVAGRYSIVDGSVQTTDARISALEEQVLELLDYIKNQTQVPANKRLPIPRY